MLEGHHGTWGWEPESLWWTRKEAEAVTDRAIAKAREEYLRRGFSEGEADAFSRREYSVLEYEIPGTPPGS